jgi:hypothetical protein
VPHHPQPHAVQQCAQLLRHLVAHGEPVVAHGPGAQQHQNVQHLVHSMQLRDTSTSDATRNTTYNMNVLPSASFWCASCWQYAWL